MLPGVGGEVPAEQWEVAVAAGPGENVDDYGFGVGDGFGDTAELDDGESGGESTFEVVDAAAELGVVAGLPRG